MGILEVPRMTNTFLLFCYVFAFNVKHNMVIIWCDYEYSWR